MLSKSYPWYFKTYYVKQLYYWSATPGDGIGQHSWGLWYYPIPHSRFSWQAHWDIWFSDLKYLPCGVNQIANLKCHPNEAFISLYLNHKGGRYWWKSSCNSISTCETELVTNPRQEINIYNKHLIKFIEAHNIQINYVIQVKNGGSQLKLGSVNQSYNNLWEHLIFVCQIYNILQNYKYQANILSTVRTSYSSNKSSDTTIIGNQKVISTTELLNNNSVLCYKIFFTSTESGYNVYSNNLLDSLNQTLCDEMPDLWPSKNYIQWSESKNKWVINKDLICTELFQLTQNETETTLVSMCSLVDNPFAINYIQILLSRKLYFESMSKLHDLTWCDEESHREACIRRIATSEPCTMYNCTCPEKTGVYPIVDKSKWYTFGY